MSVPSFIETVSCNRFTDDLGLADNLSGRCESYLVFLRSIAVSVEQQEESGGVSRRPRMCS